VNAAGPEWVSRYAEAAVLTGIICAIAVSIIAPGYAWAQPAARILDLKHYSNVFGEERNFRIFLPPSYDQTAERRYPVIYFFHGWSERYNQPPRGGRGYDSGDQYGGDNIARFVDSNDVIVVKWDGYNPRAPEEDYPRPYNISPVETYRQFPLYFPELVSHIDSHFRTIADRDHRATAGLSMGGFMSFWVAGKYPHLVGSASNFMGSSEFYGGPNGFPSEYRHTEMYRNYEGLRTRIVTGSRDFIRWYHGRMNATWKFVRPFHEQEEFDAEHGTPGMAKTLGFHMKAFREPLPAPRLWHHADVYPAFDVWGYSVQTDRHTSGFTLLENVCRSGFRSSVREWLPEGRLLPSVTVRISTDPVYGPGKAYRVTDVNRSNGEIRHIRTKSDSQGRLHFRLDGDVHEIGIAADAAPVLTLAGSRIVNAPWATAGDSLRLKLSLLNKGAAEARDIRASIKSTTAGVTVRTPRISVARIAAGESAEVPEELLLELDDGDHEMFRLLIDLDGVDVPLDIPVFRKADPMGGYVIADGTKLPVWHRAVQRSESVLGVGNGDGKAQPGETIVIAARDGEALRPVEVLTSDPCVDTSKRVSDPWGGYDNVGATAKYTIVLMASSCSGPRDIPLFVRYQLPNKPEHVLKEHVLSLSVSGRDTVPPYAESAAVRHWNRLEARIIDGARVASATATLTSSDTVLRFPLNDDGRGGDLAAGDGLFTGLAPNPPVGRYTLRIEARDEFGNSTARLMEDELEFTLPPPPRLR
jgi:S-formylglutathione hydrolase FrmB